ncbi:MAG TPA: M23 family metallopeptidase [Oscillospiraceae bacterium]|nr:M23 family metallopeptidase [Oscillospiraceae bacterium]
MAPIVASPYTWPVPGEVQKKFSMESLLYSQTMRDWRTHSGIDLSASVGTSVKAVSGGVVDAVYQDDMMGTCVVIEHANDVKSLYANLAEQPAVKVGDRVSTGDVIGAVGDTALFESSDPSHLHLEIYKDGEAVDPETILPAR